VRVEVVAVGTELLLGQILNTNAAWLGAELAAAGMDAEYQSVVGDNVERIALVFRGALARSDAVVACGGLGPTQDDITREAIAALLGVELRRDPELLAAMYYCYRLRELREKCSLLQGRVPASYNSYVLASEEEPVASRAR